MTRLLQRAGRTWLVGGRHAQHGLLVDGAAARDADVLEAVAGIALVEEQAVEVHRRARLRGALLT